MLVGIGIARRYRAVPYIPPDFDICSPRPSITHKISCVSFAPKITLCASIYFGSFGSLSPRLTTGQLWSMFAAGVSPFYLLMGCKVDAFFIACALSIHGAMLWQTNTRDRPLARFFLSFSILLLLESAYLPSSLIILFSVAHYTTTSSGISLYLLHLFSVASLIAFLFGLFRRFIFALSSLFLIHPSFTI